MSRPLVASLLVLFALGGLGRAASMNGAAGIMPAYYDGDLFTINLKELSPAAEASILAHNPSLNVIYMSDEGLPGASPS
jgi:hypothetical protein